MTEFNHIFQTIRDHLHGAAHVVIIAHQKPDGDALGSSLALSHYLESIQKPHTCFCIDEVPFHLAFLPTSEKFTANTEHPALQEADVICVLDSGDLSYAGIEQIIQSRIANGKKLLIINIDHHPTNTRYGNLNLVHEQASSTSEMIFHFLDAVRHPMTHETATCLLTGILTDTGMFSNLATTPSSLEAASRLMAYGAKIKDITQHTVRNMSLVNLQLWGRALSRLKENPETGVVTTVITRKDFDELGIASEQTEGIANFLNNLGHARMVMVLKEAEPGKIKASLRTTHPDVDVSKFAQTFGGGGHKKAAGFTVDGKLKETTKGWEVV
ncbi:MAG: DHH family phosphoesterase [Patescibacteria group bacterium]|jgi:phosphoesterase RecJ-like protein